MVYLSPQDSYASDMVRVMPDIDQVRQCPHCRAGLSGGSVVWHGMHVLIADRCPSCKTDVMTDLKVGHSLNFDDPLQVDLTRRTVHFDEAPAAKRWLGEPLLKGLLAPSTRKIAIDKRRFFETDRVVILNCIDHLYGHVLLKLLNAQRHLENPNGPAVIVIVPKFAAWLAPDGAAEVWTVDIPLSGGQAYYPALDSQIREELTRFREVYVSKAYSHPRRFDIERFTKTAVHDLTSPEYRITFIWREDRLWRRSFTARALKRFGVDGYGLYQQRQAIVELFDSLRRTVPAGRFTVAGLGTRMSFPDWIDDRRVVRFDDDAERSACRVYAESRLVIGIHGSNMLLPSAHAGMTVDLMPPDRWGNFAQDVLYRSDAELDDPRLLAFRYRYPPETIGLDALSAMIANMVNHYAIVASHFTAEARAK